MYTIQISDEHLQTVLECLNTEWEAATDQQQDAASNGDETEYSRLTIRIEELETLSESLHNQAEHQ